MTAPAHSSDRRALIAKIHIAKKSLAMVDDSYRALMMRITGEASAKDCSDAQLIKLLDEFKRLGFAAPKRKSDKPFVRMIYAIWGDLKPFLSAPDDSALASFVRRQTGIDRPEWLDGKQAIKVTEALKSWLARERAKGAAQ